MKSVMEFIKKEAVFFIAAICAILTLFLVPPDAEYLHYIDFRVLCLLFCLMAVVAGFKSLGMFRWLTYQILHRIRNGHILSAMLVLLPFFTSMLVTNDVALLIFVPFTLGLLVQLGCQRSIILILVLQTIAANLGSMATPVGNPQNLYLYAAYELSAAAFFSIVLPLTAVSFIGLLIVSFFALPKTLSKQTIEFETIASIRKLMIYAALFVVCILTVFRVIHYLVATAFVLIAVLLLDRKLLADVDYMLLATFVCFFIISENLGRLDVVRNFLQSLLQRSALLTAVGTSQIISNVPAAVLLSGFTENWTALLAGTNIGGLGTPIASLASLITLKLYLRWPEAKAGRYILIFLAANLIGLAILLPIGLHI